MQQFIGTAPRENPFVATFAERMSAVSSITPTRREELRAEAETIVTRDVYPAWTRAVSLMQSLLPKANDDAGLWRFKGGVQAYTYFLKQYTSTSLTPDQIHQKGLEQVAPSRSTRR
jgi:uncharacterized protein (DUF885 family)